MLEIFLPCGDIIKIHPALYVWIIMVLILIVTRELNVKLLQQALPREVGKFELGAHLRERGQKPEVLRQVGEG